MKNSLHTKLAVVEEFIERTLEAIDRAEEPRCTGNILCERRRYHKCEYRPVAINTYCRKILNEGN